MVTGRNSTGPAAASANSSCRVASAVSALESTGLLPREGCCAPSDALAVAPGVICAEGTRPSMLLGEVSSPITSQRAVLPSRTDLRTRRELVAARVMVRGLDLYERLKSRVLVDVTPPGEDPFYRVPEKLDRLGKMLNVT